MAVAAAPRERPRLGRVLHNLRQGLSLAWAASPASLTRFSALGVLNATLSPAAVWLGAALVNRIAGIRGGAEGLEGVWPLVAGLWAVAATQRGIGAYMGYGRDLFVRQVQLEAEHRLLRQAASVDLGHFDNSNWHDRLSRAKRDISWRPGDLTWSVLGLSGNVVTILLMATLLASLHWVLVVLALAAAGLSLLIERRVTQRMYAFYYTQTPEERERDYLGTLLAEPRGTKEVRAYVLADHLLARHRRIAETLLEKRRALYRLGARTSLLTGLVTGTSLAFAYAFVAVRGAAGTIDPGGVVLVIGAFTAVSGTLSQISSTFAAVDQHTTFLDDYFSFLAMEPLVPVPAQPRSAPAPLRGGIAFDDVSFAYAGSSHGALRGLSLEVRPGELLALVGDNGAGKSTFVKLLLRFYDPQAGTIRLGGVDLRDMDPAALRARIGVLFQDFATYELTVRENVALGRAEAALDDARILKALRDARADPVLEKLPAGLDARTGRLFEGGHDLSGGEWQRLAIARILYRDADVWVLDEPTSALDPEAEAAVFAELKANLQGRIGIVISHRFSTVRIADRIAVIADGRVTELGTHDELMALGGRYARLFELQAQGYR